MKKINSLRTIKFNVYIFISCCLIVLYALFFPALENPDETEHLSRILYQSTLWGEVTNHIGSIFVNIESLGFINEVTTKNNFSYLSNKFIYFPVNAPVEYYFLKLINVFFVLAFFFLIIKIFNGNKLVLLWPSATYYMSILNSEALGYSLMLGSTNNTKIKIFFALCISLILIFLDRSIVIFCTFLLMKFSIMAICKENLIKMKKLSILLFVISLIIYFVSIFNFNLLLDFIKVNDIRNLMVYANNLDPNHFNQIIIFLTSFMILSGSMSFYPTVFFYVYMLFLLFNSFINKRIPFEFNEHISTIFIGLSTFLIFSSLIPQLSHFRYYLFLIPPIVALFTLKYSVKHLLLLTLFAFVFNTVFLNIKIAL